VFEQSSFAEWLVGEKEEEGWIRRELMSRKVIMVLYQMGVAGMAQARAPWSDREAELMSMLQR